LTEVLVTGATGFIGRRLATRLRDAGRAVTGVGSAEGDIAELETWAKFPPAELVVHLAARTFVPDGWADSWKMMRTNLLGTVAALEYCRRHRSRLLFLSSYMYGRPQQLPIAETAPLEARNPYALSKKMAEEACRFHADAFGVPVTILRPFNVYGPGQSERFLIPSIIRQLESGSEIRVKDLKPRRDYVYVDDLVEAIASATDRIEAFGVFNIGSGVSHSVAEVTGLIQKVWGMSLPVGASGERRPDEVMDTVAEISLARQRLGWTPRFSLEAGLRDMHRRQGMSLADPDGNCSTR
jgi:GDP-4-dehydro-6-deoxy-D-mannose reductase